MYSRQVKMFWLEIVSTYSLSQWMYRKGGMRKWLLSLVLAKYGKFCKSGVFFRKGLYKSGFLVYYIEKWLEVARSGKEWLKNQWDAIAVAISAEIKASRAKELLLKKTAPRSRLSDRKTAGGIVPWICEIKALKAKRKWRNCFLPWIFVSFRPFGPEGRCESAKKLHRRGFPPCSHREKKRESKTKLRRLQKQRGELPNDIPFGTAKCSKLLLKGDVIFPSSPCESENCGIPFDKKETAKRKRDRKDLQGRSCPRFPSLPALFSPWAGFFFGKEGNDLCPLDSEANITTP